MSEGNRFVLKSVFVGVALIVLLVVFMQNTELERQLDRASQETLRVHDLVNQIQSLGSVTIADKVESVEQVREDYIPYAARAAGLNATAVKRIRPEQIKKDVGGRSVSTTRVNIERVEFSSLIKMLIAIEDENHSVVVAGMTCEYVETTKQWNAEIVITQPVFGNQGAN